MTGPSSQPPDPPSEVTPLTTDDPLGWLVQEWERRRNAGAAPTPEELCPDDPNLCEQLRLRLARALSEYSANATTGLAPTQNAPAGLARAPSAPAGPVSGPPGYTITRELGRGGMGVVYLAVQQRLNRPVALKMVPGAQDNQRQLIRFLVEAEATATVRHPNVAQVYECGEHAGQPFLALEYLEGGGLVERLRQSGRLPAAEAAELVRKIARGIEAAHRQGVIHRDLKPGNVLFDGAGEPKVTDFGLAKHGSGQDLTATQATMGTPAYMAPEQARGETKYAGPPADVYALGVILYECLTGAPPFKAERPILVLDKVINEAPLPPSKRAPEVPFDLEVICLKCLRKEPEKRYATAGELADDLQRYLAGEPIEARPAGKVERAVKWARRHPTWSLVAVFALLVALVGTVASIQYRRRIENNRARLLVNSLRTATPNELPRLRADLVGLRPRTEPLVRDLLVQSRSPGSADERAELNAALVLLQWGSDELPFVLERILTAPPEDVLLYRELLEPRSVEVRERLGPVVADRSAARARRLRAQAVLAEEGASVPAELADDLVGQMLIEDRLLLSGWVRALRPVRASLIDPLVRRYIRGADDEAGIGAALILREYLQGDTERVVPLLDKGGLRQAFLLGAALRAEPRAEKKLLEEWHRFAPEAPRDIENSNHDDAIDAEERRRTKIGLALLAAGHAAPVWRGCAVSACPRRRTYLIHGFARAGVSPQALQGALVPDVEPSVRQAVYLAWGEYPTDNWGNNELEAVVRQVVDDYTSHPDPGVHSAAEWLLRRWGLAGRLQAAGQRLPTEKARGGRRWFVNSQGTTFAVIPGPTDTVVGTYWWEAGWASREPFFGAERVHRRRAPRSYAIATKEVTFDQARQFLRECRDSLPGDRAFGMNWSSRTGDSPVVHFSWFEAVMFCRWLSEKEGVAEGQQCYPPLKEIRPGMKLPADYLERTGYRLPTEAEWEHACRAGSRTPYSFGSDLSLLASYAWHERNTPARMQPVGLLRPNLFGLFDMHGNASEWCDVRAVAYPSYDSLGPPVLDEADRGPCNPADRCVLRGGEFSNGPVRLRGGHRTVVERTNHWPGSGFRLARTVASPAMDVYQIGTEGRRARFAVLGKPGRYRITNVVGGVAIEPREGAIPGTVEVVAAGPAAREYSFVVERPASGEKAPISGLFIRTDWKARWYAWELHTKRHDLPPSEAAWTAAIRGKPLCEERLPHLRFSWTDKHPAPGVPAQRCGLVATAEIDLPAGTYEFACVANPHGCRLFLNGEWLLGQTWNNPINRAVAVRALPAGKHLLRVEYYVTVGEPSFDLRVRRAPPGPPLPRCANSG